MEEQELTKNAGFLQHVICMLAEEKFVEEIIDTGSEDEIGPGEQWDSKGDWLNDTISEWFNTAAKKIKMFPNEPDLKVKKMSIELAQSLYKIPLGGKFDLPGEVDSFVMRVPGGWIYILDVAGSEQKPVFVPHTDEFLSISNLDESDILKI